MCTCVGLLARVNGMGFCLCARRVVLKSKNPPKISSPEVISRVFTVKIQPIQIIFVYFICFTFKNCQTVVDISRINQFPDFNNLIFGGFLQFGPTLCRSLARSTDFSPLCSDKTEHTQ